MLDRFEKALLFVAASIQAHAAVTASGAGQAKIPISPDISDPNLRALNLEDWEEFRIFYHATLAALDDDQSWPPPNLGLGVLSNVLGDPGKLAASCKACCQCWRACLAGKVRQRSRKLCWGCSTICTRRRPSHRVRRSPIRERRRPRREIWRTGCVSCRVEPAA